MIGSPPMKTLAAVTIAWAGVYGALAIFYALLYARRRSDREFLAFAGLSAGLTVFALGASLNTTATDLAAGTQACIVQWCGIAIAIACYVDFVHHMLGLPAQWLVRTAYAWSLFGLAANIAGLFFDPDQIAPPDTWGLDGAPIYVEPAVQPIGAAWAIASIGLLAQAVFLLVRHAKRDPDARILLATSALWVLGGCYDLFLQLTSIKSFYVLEHVGIIANLSMSWILVGRFVRTSEALEARTRELHASYQNLQQTQEELLAKEQLAAVGELSAVIAHEVRNPLAIIKNAVSGLRRRELPEDDRAVLHGILDEEAERLNRLVTDLLAFARPVTPQRRDVPIAELVSRAIELARAGSRTPADVQVELDVEAGPSSLACDPDLLRQALVNVAENALEAMPRGGTLSVRVERASLGEEPAVALIFRDSGEGMDATVRSKARDPFFTTRPSGTGLGLAIVDRIARAHGGAVELESRRGVGTTVSLVLPDRRPSYEPPTPRKFAQIAASTS
jgi:signal transduction histidine kinase